MSNTGFTYGMSAQVAKKLAGKRDEGQEKAVQHFIEGITGKSFDSSLNYEENLKDGVRLMELVKCLDPKVKKITKASTPFQKMENIEMFLTFAEKYGVPKNDLFQVANLYEGKNISAVTAGIIALGRVCHLKPEWDSQSPSFKNWPTLGPKPATEHVREFDEETIAKGKNVIGIQAGTNKLASQSGQSFGAKRQVN